MLKGELRRSEKFKVSLSMEQALQESPRAWQSVVTKKRQQQADAINAFREFPAQQSDSDVTEISDIQVLAEKLATGELTTEYVVRSYIAR